MTLDFLFDVFDRFSASDAIIWQDQVYQYGWLSGRVHHWTTALEKEGIRPGCVVVLEGGFSPNSLAVFLALVQLECVVIPQSRPAPAGPEQLVKIARAQFLLSLDSSDELNITSLEGDGGHPLYNGLRGEEHPGLVLFTSGSTGESKGSVHDMSRLLEKFKNARRRFRSIAFLLYDHIGGINTMLYSLSNGGCLVTVDQLTPDAVLAAIQAHQVDLLPTTPTFINLVLLSEAYQRYDISCLTTVTYGTEPMPEATLERFHQLFPDIRLQQTYGNTELGILRSNSKSSDSLWVRVGGEGYETRVVDGVLHIKAESAMLGYLNAPDPFTEDGWFNTGDSVLVDGEYFRFVGRESEVINVGGQKVFPVEVESVIQEMDGVLEVTVYGEPNPILGNIVCAMVRIHEGIKQKEFAAALKMFCKARLRDYKAPVKVVITDELQHGERFKKARPVPGKR